MAIKLLVNALACDPGEEIPVSHSYILKIGHNYKGDVLGSGINTLATLEKAMEYIHPAFELNRKFSRINNRCRTVTVKDSEKLKAVQTLMKTLLLPSCKDLKTVNIFSGESAGNSASSKERAYKASLATAIEEDRANEVKPLSPSMVDYQTLTNKLTHQASKAVHGLLKTSRIKKADTQAKKEHHRKVAAGVDPNKALSSYGSAVLALDKLDRREAEYYRLTKDLSPRVFDNVYQGLPRVTLPILWKGCTQFDFSRSQLCILSNLMPNLVFDKYLVIKDFWGILKTELNKSTGLTYEKGQLKLAMYTLTFGGGWSRIKKSWMEDFGADETIANGMIVGIQNHDLFKTLNDTKDKIINHLKDKKFVKIAGQNISIYDFKTKDKTNLHQYAASAMAHKLQYMESMMMFAVLKAVKAHTESNSDAKHAAHLCVVKHDGVILKLGSRLKAGKPLGAFHSALQQAADAEAVRFGLSAAPKLEIDQY